LHLFGDVVSFELNLLHFRREFDKTVSNAQEGLKTNSAFDHFTVPDDQQPLIRFRLHKSVLHEESKATSSNEETADSPNVPGRTEEDGRHKTTCETIEGEEFVRDVKVS
jgi:hypothetical protein